MTVQSLFLGKLIMKTKTGPFSTSFLFFFSLAYIFFNFQKREFILLVQKSIMALASGYYFTDSLLVVMKTPSTYFNS